MKEDFAIVLQNFTKHLRFPPKTDSTGKSTCDLTYLSEDCFHFSQKGYARGHISHYKYSQEEHNYIQQIVSRSLIKFYLFAATNALWNNMLEPDGFKTPSWPKEFEKFLCPTERSPYIYTWKNSRL